MSAIVPQLNRGALLQAHKAAWGPLYEAIFNILGDGATLLPLLDPSNGQPNATTFTTKRRTSTGLEATFTWSEAPSAFDTPADLTDPDKWQGIIPVVQTNGTDEEADTPDDDYWSPGNGTTDTAFSVGALLRPRSTNASVILVKGNSDSNLHEWRLEYSSSPKLELNDASAGAKRGRNVNNGGITDRWQSVIATYNGDESDPNAGVNIYLDGEPADDTDNSTAGTYTAMENSGNKLMFGARLRATPDWFFDGKIAGGPLGPFFTTKELTAAEVKRLYEIGRDALALV